jgi:Trk K+ transport system NAD-binding subunit
MLKSIAWPVTEARSPIMLLSITASCTRTSPLKDLDFPEGAIIGAVVHKDTYEIPTGERRLREGDRVVVFALPGALSKIERFFE